MAPDGIFIGMSILAGAVLGPTALLVLPAPVLAFQFLRGRWVWSRMVMVLICALIGIWRSASVSDPMQITELAQSTGAVGVIDALPVAGGSNERSVLRVEQLEFKDGVWRDVSGRVLVYLGDGTTVHAGDRVMVAWSASSNSAEPPGYAAFLATQNVSGSAQVWSSRTIKRGPTWLGRLSDVRRAIGRQLQLALPGDTGALAAGIVTGDDSGLSPEVESAFQRSGTSHITAVSGQNIGLLLAFCAIWMRPTNRSTRVATHIAMISIVWLYALMVGLEAPALRAAIVATLTILGTYAGRRPDPLTLLALTLGGMVLVDPRMTQGAGFWLSASASYALCSVMRGDGEPSIRAFARQALRSVLAANIATLPILIWVFGEWSPLSPLANLLIGPLLTLTFPAAYLLALILLVLPQAAPFLAWLPGIGLDTTIVIVQRIGDVLPVMNLNVVPAVGAMLAGGPCFVVLVLLNRDGDRWLRIIDRKWRTHRTVMVSATCGTVVGAAFAVLILMLT
jgi:ComEC/Rec2-related protein